MGEDREEPLLGELDDTPAADNGEGAAYEPKRSLGFLPWGVGLLILLAVAWFLYPEPVEQPVSQAEPAPVEVAPAIKALPPAPDIPVPEPPSSQETSLPETKVETLPPVPALQLEDSDEPVREALGTVGSPELFDVPIQQDDLLPRGAAIVDGLSRGVVLHKVISLPRPEGKFATLERSGEQVIDPGTFHRYDSYSRAIAGLDTGALVGAFHRFRPLLEEAYSQLGFEGAEFDNALIRSLDVVIATPEIQGEISVKPKGGVYVFSDPALEELPPLQKQLLRTGPENLSLIKQQAMALRAGLLGAGEDL